MTGAYGGEDDRVHLGEAACCGGKRRLLVTACAVLLCCAFAFSQTSDRRDGNWWTNSDAVSKYSYVTGFFDGMDLGRNFSIWKIVKQKEKASCVSAALDSYEGFNNRYFKNVTNQQISDGLDEFYKDYRNRSILISDAVWPVLRSIAGEPKDQIDYLTENLRRNATK